jgi:4-hydroxymandelate oxidase
MSNHRFNRRQALQGFSGVLAGVAHVQEPRLIGEPPGRIAPLEELVNVFEVEAMAQRKLANTDYAEIAGSDRRIFERMIFRPRRMVNVSNLDLTTDLVGIKMYAPILLGPVSKQQQFHPEGELAVVRGAGAAKAVTVISSLSSYPLQKIVAEAKAPLWYQAYPEPDMNKLASHVEQAVQAGCKAVCLTIGTPYQPSGAEGPPNPAKLAVMGNPSLDWKAIDRFRESFKAPLVLKGIMSAEEAKVAAQRGIPGIVVSNHGGRFSSGQAEPMEVLAGIVDAAAGKTAVVIDGSFRRGTDILKALMLGANAVMVARPAMWGLAAYGADGVQAVLEMLQTELARSMGLCGRTSPKSLDRAMVKLHVR